MRQALLDLLHNNPLSLPEIVDWFTRFPHAEVDPRKIGEMLRAMAREVPAWVGQAGDEWVRIGVVEVPKNVCKQGSLFDD